jgi:hypothetical protein
VALVYANGRPAPRQGATLHVGAEDADDRILRHNNERNSTSNSLPASGDRRVWADIRDKVLPFVLSPLPARRALSTPGRSFVHGKSRYRTRTAGRNTSISRRTRGRRASWLHSRSTQRAWFWDLDSSTAMTQLIAHDHKVYGVVWLSNSTNTFVSAERERLATCIRLDSQNLKHRLGIRSSRRRRQRRSFISRELVIHHRRRCCALRSTRASWITRTRPIRTVRISSATTCAAPVNPVTVLSAHLQPNDATRWSSAESRLVSTADGWVGGFLPFHFSSLQTVIWCQLTSHARAAADYY